MKDVRHPHSNAKHMALMSLACIVPLAILVALHFFGISGKWITGGVFVLMIFLHMLMMTDHSSHCKKDKGRKK